MNWETRTLGFSLNCFHKTIWPVCAWVCARISHTTFETVFRHCCSMYVYMNNIRMFVPKHRDHAIVQHSCDVWASTGMLRISFEIIALYCLYLVICSLFRNGELFIFFSTLSSFPLRLWEMVKNERTSNKMHGATLAIKVAAVLRLERIENWIQSTWGNDRTQPANVVFLFKTIIEAKGAGENLIQRKSSNDLAPMPCLICGQFTHILPRLTTIYSHFIPINSYLLPLEVARE